MENNAYTSMLLLMTVYLKDTILKEIHKEKWPSALTFRQKQTKQNDRELMQHILACYISETLPQLSSHC